MSEFDALFVLGLAEKVGLVKVRYMMLDKNSNFIGEYDKSGIRRRWRRKTIIQICYRLIV